VTAQDKYERRRTVHQKLIANPELKAAVEGAPKAGWSPEQIAGRMRLEQHRIRVSHETICRFACSKPGVEEAFYRPLPAHRRRRRPCMHRRYQRSRIQDSQILCHRPLAIAKRQVFGHWECDLMMFRKENGKVKVTSLVEQVSRFTVAMRNEDRHSEPIMEALIAGRPLPTQARQSITFDRGTEFPAWRQLKDGIGAVSWFCDPQAPWQKGTVENTNGRLRKHLPRSTESTSLTNQYLRSICQSLDSTPRKCPRYRTLAALFESNLIAISSRWE